MYSQDELEYIGYLLAVQSMHLGLAQEAKERLQPRIAYIYHNGSEAGIECLGKKEKRNQ